jgi:hypothetical protein
MSTTEGFIECDLVTFHRAPPGRDVRAGRFNVDLDQFDEELGSVELHGQTNVSFSPVRDTSMYAVAWFGGVPMYRFATVLIPKRASYWVGPFPLAFTASDT